MFEMELNYHDAKIMKRVVNQGIDSWLEGFCKSTFKFTIDEIGCQRLHCIIHNDEIQILVRRLLEYDEERAGTLADDIVMVEYGCEEL